MMSPTAFASPTAQMTSQEQGRRSTSGAMLKQNRDMLTRALQGVRLSLQQFVQNKTAQSLMANAAETAARLGQSQGEWSLTSDTWDADEPVRTFAYTRTSYAPATAENPTPAPTTETRIETLGYDAAKRFVLTDSTVSGGTVYLHAGMDSPTIEEYLAIVHAFMSYAYYNGELDEAVIQALVGQPALSTELISRQLDAWA